MPKCPEEFTYEGKKYTPKSFMASLGINLDDYVSITSYTHHPFYTTFAVEVQDNWRFPQSYNLPMDEMMKVIDNAIDKGYTIAWGGDVSEDGFTRKGLAYAVDGKAAQSDHGMLIYGVAKDQNGKEYYMVKNSWGETGDYKGIWYMTKAFIAANTMDFLINKNAIPKDIRKKLGL